MSSVLVRDEIPFGGDRVGGRVGNHLMRVAVQGEFQFIHTDGSTFVGQVCWTQHATVVIVKGAEI